MKVICISGKAGSGKDTFANYAKDYLEQKNNRVLICHFADLVKYVCKTFFNWDGNKDENGRTLLQHVGTDVVREKNPNYWVHFIMDMIKFFGDSWDYVLIPDCRFPNEYNQLAGICPTWLVRIERPNNNILTDTQAQHSSETAMDDYPADITLLNESSLDVFKVAIRNIINMIEKYE